MYIHILSAALIQYFTITHFSNPSELDQPLARFIAFHFIGQIDTVAAIANTIIFCSRIKQIR
jgi:hypothetical protein